MEKLNYENEVLTENNEKVLVSTYETNSDIYLGLIDDEEDCAIVTLTLKEAQRVKRYYN